MTKTCSSCTRAALLFVSRACSIKTCTIRCLRADQLAGPDISLLSTLLQLQWDHVKNAHLGSIVLRAHSNRKVWWNCDQCPDGHPHQWEAAVNARTRGTACPYCANKAVCQHNSLATKAPAIAPQFSDKDQGTAHDYLVSSNKTVIWQCQHGHEWEARIMTWTTMGQAALSASTLATDPNQRRDILSWQTASIQ